MILQFTIFTFVVFMVFMTHIKTMTTQPGCVGFGKIKFLQYNKLHAHLKNTIKMLAARVKMLKKLIETKPKPNYQLVDKVEIYEMNKGAEDTSC